MKQKVKAKLLDEVEKNVGNNNKVAPCILTPCGAIHSDLRENSNCVSPGSVAPEGAGGDVAIHCDAASKPTPLRNIPIGVRSLFEEGERKVWNQPGKRPLSFRKV